MTLMSQFRYPGVFAAGVANAAVSDWAHYSDGWTSRILGVPHEDPEAYRRSSPIYYADGLEDNLLIVHGLVDDNVHFQDAARVVQRLIELEKDFEVMGEAQFEDIYIKNDTPRLTLEAGGIVSGIIGADLSSFDFASPRTILVCFFIDASSLSTALMILTGTGGPI